MTCLLHYVDFVWTKAPNNHGKHQRHKWKNVKMTKVYLQKYFYKSAFVLEDKFLIGLNQEVIQQMSRKIFLASLFVNTTLFLRHLHHSSIG